ncbi:MAG: BrnT family toxin [Bacteroidetes bacterium]|nr:BrnT family toxin [Bacteroidota bacterium]
MLMFEFDDNKSNANVEKHGIDFYNARALWDDPFRVEIPARITNGEQRFLLIAKLNDKYWTCVYTIRNNTIRIISVRKSRSYEKEIYNS